MTKAEITDGIWCARGRSLDSLAHTHSDKAEGKTKLVAMPLNQTTKTGPKDPDTASYDLDMNQAHYHTGNWGYWSSSRFSSSSLSTFSAASKTQII